MAAMYLTGICRWAKVQTPDAKYKYFGLELLPDAASLETLLAAGITTIKPSKDGEGYYSFKRRPDQDVFVNRERVKAGPPLVLDENGEKTDVFIGNGSKVQIKIDVFPYNNTYGQGVSARLEAVKILELVPFEKPDTDKPQLRIMF